ncbi:putative flavin-containing monooxygenase [Helianthus anomalus]
MFSLLNIYKNVKLITIIYRESIHTRIPQLAVIGFFDGLSSLYTSEMNSRWVTTLLEGAIKLPSVKDMQKDISRWDGYMKRSSGEYHTRSVLGGIEIWYNDLLCKDMGMNPIRKKGLMANLFEAYGLVDYAQI